MKHTFLLFLSLVLLTSCENEPLGSSIVVDNPVTDPDTDPGTDPDPDTGDNNSFQLSDYTYRKDISDPLGNFFVDVNFEINAQGVITSQITESEIFGTPINGNSPLVRDQNGRIIETYSVVNGVTVNETLFSYNGDDIIQINHNDLESPQGSYIYNFDYNGNVVTRSEEGSTRTVEFTFDSEDRLIKREIFEAGTSVRTEEITYNNGNLISSVITGQNPMTLTYTYDSNTNPLNSLFAETYKFQLFDDNYDDQFEHWLAILHSSNNVIEVTTPQGTSNLNVVYDSENRITERSGSIFSGLDAIGSENITTLETFSY